jgi:neutral ceramidase
MKRFLRILGRFLAIIVAIVALIAAFCVRPLDDTPYSENDFYKTMMARLDSLPATPIDSFPYDDKGELAYHYQRKPAVDTSFCVGWSKVNLTPLYPVPTAGYGNRKGQLVSRIHDSLYTKAFVFKNGASQAAIVSCDMLIIPPEVTLKVKADLKSIGWSWQHVFIGATHTHNSMGAWGKRYIGELFAGKYDQNIVDFISKSIVQSIVQAQADMEPVTYQYHQIQAYDYVYNRLLNTKGEDDGLIRMLTFTKQSGKRAALVTYAAHCTTLSDTVMQLSRDYSGILEDKLVRENGLDQAVFMAGSVGSMGPTEPKELNDWQQAQYMADGLEDKIDDALKDTNSFKINNLRIETIPLSMREPQWRISENWCLRHWVWSWLYGDYDAEVKALLIDNNLLVGLPCDFSGELMHDLMMYGHKRHSSIIITSFNGGYVGYITKDAHYDMNKYETRTMNWFGPGNGAYFSEIVKKILDKM